MPHIFAHTYGVLLLIAALTMLPGCGGARDAVTLNDNIVKSQQRLAVAGREFGETITPVVRGENPNVAMMQMKHEDAVAALTAVKAEMGTWTIPPKDSAQKLYASFQSIMAIQEEAIAKFGQIVTVAKNAKMSNDAKTQEIVQIIRSIEDRENVALADLQAKQRVFAKDFNIKLIGN